MKVVGYITEGKNRAVDKAVRHVTQQLGGAIRGKGSPEDCDLAVVWGYKVDRPNMRHAIESGTPILVLEQIAWRQVGHTKGSAFSLGYNGLQGGAYVPPAPTQERYKPVLKPMRANEGQITIFGQVPGDAALRGMDCNTWITETREGLAIEYPNREIVVREHPLCFPSWEQHLIEPFDECIDKTGLAVTYSSTTGAEALIAGIPTRADHWGSLAYPVTKHGQDREEWLHELSWRHWQINESIDREWLLGGYDEARALAEDGKYDQANNR